MKTFKSEGKHEIQWTVWMQLGNSDFTDDLAILFHIHQQIQKGKARILKYNTESTNQITLDGKALEEVETFSYLGSIIDKQRGSDTDVKAQMGKGMEASLQSENNCQPRSNTGSSLQTSRQFYCTKLKPGELLKRPIIKEKRNYDQLCT
ncbi:unnamed protein product [Schistosoma margrebowiei]|uniref:Uncharacterized protein n=1 Tax=Schistosoma margrebowiei TaxID=48269 RepID=A0A183LQ01_9TREM|nr:unnamed protein product [Schistosoma margrebowiei]